MKVYNLMIFTILALILGFAACSNANGNGNGNSGKDDSGQPIIDTDKIKDGIKNALGNISGKIHDVINDKEKYIDVLDYIKNHPEEAAKQAGLDSMLQPNFISMPVGIALIAAGLFLAFTGRRLFNLFLGVSGFIIGSSVFLYILVSVQTLFALVLPQWAFWVAGLIGGMLGSALFKKMWKWAVYGMSAYGGVMLGLWILGMINGTDLSKYIERNTFLIIFGLIGLLSGHYVDEFVVISSSSLMGAVTAVFGFDMIKPVGFRLFVMNTFDNTSVNIADVLLTHTLSDNVRYCMIGVLFITVIGIYIQYRHQPRTYDQE